MHPNLLRPNRRRAQSSRGSLAGFALLAFLLVQAVPAARAVTSISQYGITWTFAADHVSGQYANGDYWVVGPVTITGITPASTVIANRPAEGGGTVANSIVNGSMVNPVAGPLVSQGFDNALDGGGSYVASLNAARPGGNNLSPANPLVLPAGSSLVSSISHPNAYRRPALTDAAVLTVVAAPPPAGAFRPPYQGTDKSFSKRVSDLNYGILLSLAPVTGTPTIASLEPLLQRPWIEINTSHQGWFLHPTNNQGPSGYGRDLAYDLGSILLALHLNYTNAQKETLFIRLVQYGIDVYGAASTGGEWFASGGHNHGRKMPMLLAGLALNEPAIIAKADATQAFIFQEDQQTWIVTAADVGRQLVDETAQGRIHEPYIAADIGLPEWGEKHFGAPERDGRNWNTFYRDAVGTSMLAHILAAHFTQGARSAWKWEPLFLYMDRHYATELSLVGFDNAPYIVFHKQMWAAYRNATSGSVNSPSNLRIVP